jgi:hypothetical protein
MFLPIRLKHTKRRWVIHPRRFAQNTFSGGHEHDEAEHERDDEERAGQDKAEGYDAQQERMSSASLSLGNAFARIGVV